MAAAFQAASSGSPLFYLYPAPTSVPAGYTIAFLADASSGLPGSVDLPTTWTSVTGVYLFLGTTVSNVSAFIAAMRGYLAGSTTRMLWLANPNDLSSSWQVQAVGLTGSAPMRAIPRSTTVMLRNYGVFFAGGVNVSINQTQDGFTFTVPGGQAQAIAFQMAGGAPSAPSITGTASLSYSSVPGTLQFALSMNASASANVDTFDVGIRYYIHDPAWPSSNSLRSIRYPVLTAATAAFGIQATFDPIFPLMPSRTALTISALTPLVSAYRTIYGQPVSLGVPRAVSAPLSAPQLVFAVNQSSKLVNPQDPLTLTYGGAFSVSFGTNVNTVQKMTLGISSLEYSSITPGVDLLNFTPNQPAYAPPPDPRAGATVPALSSIATTAWAAIASGSATASVYYAQPSDATLYQGTVSARDTSSDPLYYMEVPAGSFPGSATPCPPFPTVPYSALATADVPFAQSLEDRVLSRARRGVLVPALGPPPPVVGSTTVGATPQGLLVNFDSTLTQWQMLTFARNQGGAQLLQLATITGGFKAALQSNQLFTVISNPDVFLSCAAPVGTFAVTLDGWRFGLLPNDWRAHQTLMLIKFSDKAIAELAKDASTWNWQQAAGGYGTGRGGTITDVQRDLLSLISDARDADAATDLHAFYNNVLNNAQWSGILFLRAPLNGALPPQLAGLAAGINASQFYANHLGFNLTPVNNNGGTLTLSDSSIFGLINYNDPEHLTYNGSPYDFKVLSLNVRFVGSKMASFASTIELMMCELLGEGVELVPDGDQVGRGNNLVLHGYYQSQGGRGAYIFNASDVNRFASTSPILEDVDVQGAEYAMLDESSSTNVTTSQFVLRGLLRFRPVDLFDAFSFGYERDKDASILKRGGLAFSRIVIRMAFPTNDPTTKTFVFDASKVAFDPTNSTPRSGSLFAHFPLKLVGLVQGVEKSSPGDQGYITVASPVGRGPVNSPWFGLSFTFDMGTLGALVSNVGLNVGLIAAWTPGTSKKALVGLKLPSLGGAATAFSIEGVLGVGFRSIEFTAALNTSKQTEYVLRLRKLALRILSVSFPPGTTDLYIFGDPSGGRSGTLGWYAAYAKEPEGAARG